MASFVFRANFSFWTHGGGLSLCVMGSSCSHGGRAKSKPLKSLQCLGFSEMFAADVLRQLQGYLKRASERIRKLQLALNVFREIEGMTRFLMALPFAYRRTSNFRM